ncbi:hypothetical protein SAMN05192563_1015156 [Paraburkholderia aspalathi]|uniref:Uncharacterized protein n=1 Tax=Paraburkholderia aspalathi TaxID=1324617 RepID=A0A1I7EAR2_9BURK|nr:hypothetical protein SAMN05192563_1015156 [Paraburkholderia aspalathi]
MLGPFSRIMLHNYLLNYRNYGQHRTLARVAAGPHRVGWPEVPAAPQVAAAQVSLPTVLLR